jgi:cell division FtsZ-interacting protein ZapD
MIPKGKSFIFEYPINECIRTCLKLEPILKKIERISSQTLPLQHKTQILLLITLIHILDRQDIKTKFVKLITQQQANLIALQDNDKVDQATLQFWIQKLKNLSTNLQNTSSLTGSLKQDPLISFILQQPSSTQSVPNFMAPQLQCWLQLPDEHRLNQLAKWRQNLTLIEQLIHTLLPLIRNSKPFKQEVSEAGFFQTNLNKEQEIHLVRIKLYQPDLYPEISIGKHRMILHFISIYTQQQVNAKIEFDWMTSSLLLAKNNYSIMN